jgi:hypothetical protein
VHSEKACDHKDHDHYADDVENIHRLAPIETCTVGVILGHFYRIKLFNLDHVAVGVWMLSRRVNKTSNGDDDPTLIDEVAAQRLSNDCERYRLLDLIGITVPRQMTYYAVDQAKLFRLRAFDATQPVIEAPTFSERSNPLR